MAHITLTQEQIDKIRHLISNKMEILIDLKSPSKLRLFLNRIMRVPLPNHTRINSELNSLNVLNHSLRLVKEGIEIHIKN